MEQSLFPMPSLGLAGKRHKGNSTELFFFLHPKKERKNYPQWQRQQLQEVLLGLLLGSEGCFTVPMRGFSPFC
jgi:hypothetical protein